MKTLKSIIALIFLFSLTVSSFAQRSDDKSENWDVDNVITLSGNFTSVTHPIATFKGDDGNEYEVHMGPIWFWNENGYELKANNSAQIKGEVKQVQNRYELYPWKITQDNSTIDITDENSVPKWSKGNKGKNFKGNKNRDGNKKGRGYNGNCPYGNK